MKTQGEACRCRRRHDRLANQPAVVAVVGDNRRVVNRLAKPPWSVPRGGAT